MNITLSTWERVHLAMAVGSQQGNVARIKSLTGILDVLELDTGEKLMTGWSQTTPGAVTWANNLDWTLDFSDDQFKELCAVAIPYERWPVHRNVDQMITKLTNAMMLKKANDPE